MAPLVTGKVRDQLATVNPDNVPDGHFTATRLPSTARTRSRSTHYDTGLTLVGYLIDDGTHWLLYAYDRWQD